METLREFPIVIDIRSYDTGFVVKINTISTYYQYLEDLAKAIYPRVRQELSQDGSCAGSC